MSDETETDIDDGHSDGIRKILRLSVIDAEDEKGLQLRMKVSKEIPGEIKVLGTFDNLDDLIEWAERQKKK